MPDESRTTVVWRPVKNTERNAIRRSPGAWHVVDRHHDRVLISDTGDWRCGDLRWINEDQITGCQQ